MQFIRRKCLAVSILVLATASFGAGCTHNDESREPKVTAASELSSGMNDESMVSKIEVVSSTSKGSGAPSVTEFRITANQGFSARAFDPVLIVGGTVLRQYRYEGHRALIFSVDTKKLPSSGPIYFGWSEGEVVQKSKTPFEYVGPSTVQRQDK